MASPYQDEIAVLQLLRAALSEYGGPGGIVSDNAGVFTAHAYKRVVNKLEVESYYIEKGQGWQNLIEAHFKIQLRLADAKLSKLLAWKRFKSSMLPLSRSSTLTTTGRTKIGKMAARLLWKY